MMESKLFCNVVEIILPSLMLIGWFVFCDDFVAADEQKSFIIIYNICYEFTCYNVYFVSKVIRKDNEAIFNWIPY